MILSNVEIHQALDEGRLRITPEPAPRFREGGTSSPFSTSAVDLTLSHEISYFSEKLPLKIDLNQGSFASLFSRNSTTKELTDEQPFILQPGRLVLGNTREIVELPLDQGTPCLAARVEGKSSYARCGLLVHFTAPTVHAGFRGTITLELINLGPFDITLTPGTPICQLIVETVAGIPLRNDSQFQGQFKPGGNI